MAFHCATQCGQNRDLSLEKRYNARFFASPSRPMKLHLSQRQHFQTVTAYHDHGVEINAVEFNHSLIVAPELAPSAWPVDQFSQLTEAHFQTIAEIHPDIVILGTGTKQHFVHPKLVASLTKQRIGVECMDSQAACRTYNILMAEERKVVLALIIENKDQSCDE